MPEPPAIKAPFPWFGGKGRVAPIVWPRLGEVRNYVEPFFGSGAMLLGRPNPAGTETVNDLDGYVANFWRAVKAAPDEVAEYADNPVNENDLHARHIWLVNEGRDRVSRLEGDPDYYDAKVAGWWVWGMCCWIGSGFCSGKGPWGALGGQLVHLGGAGQGVNRQRVHLGDAGRGVNRQRVHLGDAGQGQCEASRTALTAYMRELCDRLRLVRVCCGDWKRVCGPGPTVHLGMAAVFLDPPYGGDTGRQMDIYSTDSGTVAGEVLAWCKANGGNPLLRIALCGYEGEHDELSDAGWDVIAWKAAGGYGRLGEGGGRANAHRERIWFSPACVRPDVGMFGRDGV